MKNPLVSVIIPVYNQKKYLNLCLKSVIAQTYSNLEIILIDNGSNDGSAQVCDKWRKKDTRIRVYHIKNSGVSYARNIGLKYSNGELIYFIDSDDWICQYTINKMVRIMIKYQVDLVFSQYDELYHFSNINEKEKNVASVCLYGQRDIIKFILEGKKLTNHVWRGIYKRKLIKPDIFPVGKNYEDMYSMLEFVEKCKKIAIINQILYHHRVNNNSITHSWNFKNCMDYCDSVCHESQLALTLYPDLKLVVTHKVIKDVLYVWNNAVRSDIHGKSFKKVLRKLNDILNKYYSKVAIPLNVKIQLCTIKNVKMGNKFCNRLISLFVFIKNKNIYS